MKNVKVTTSAITLASLLFFIPAISFAESTETKTEKADIECPEQDDVAMMGGMGMGMGTTGTGTTGTMGTMGTMGGMGMGGMGMGMMNSEDGQTPENEVTPDGAITHSPCSKTNTDDQTQ